MKAPVPSGFEDLKHPGPIAGSMFTPEEMSQIKVKDEPRRPPQPAAKKNPGQ
jgi:hypothetical protein